MTRLFSKIWLIFIPLFLLSPLPMPGAPASLPAMRATRDRATGQIFICENQQPVLCYNYQTNYPGDLLSRVKEPSKKYAQARSDYIHPLFGLNGEVLTEDWSVDHPHHRGIYWAWPEVDYGTNRGDLHALQKVFARPTGKYRLQEELAFAEVEAENNWLWEDREPIVQELTLIRAQRAEPGRGRIIDLVFQFRALKGGVTIARRHTNAYGGLNVRLATNQSQAIFTFTAPADASPRRAWSDLSGVFEKGLPAGLSVLQCARNPDYPGDWIEYPHLAWCQPTFPAAGTRYSLRKDKPLVLSFRLWVHTGLKPADDFAAKLWDAYTAPSSLEPIFRLQ